MNKLHIGFTKNIELPKGDYLLIDDEVKEIPRGRIFDPLKHCLNPLKNTPPGTRCDGYADAAKSPLNAETVVNLS